MPLFPALSVGPRIAGLGVLVRIMPARPSLGSPRLALAAPGQGPAGMCGSAGEPAEGGQGRGR